MKHLIGVEKRQKMQFPLGEMLAALREFKDSLPSLQAIPKKMSRIDRDVSRLVHQVESEYLTISNYKVMNNYQSSDLQTLVDNVASQTLNKVESMIETRIPFQQLKEFMTQRGALQSFRTAEKRVMKIASDFDNLRNKLQLMEDDSKRYEQLFFGLTKEKLNSMVKVAQDYERNSQVVQRQLEELTEKVNNQGYKFEEEARKTESLKEAISNQASKIENV